MTNELTTTNQDQIIKAGQVADVEAAATAFIDYRIGKAPNTTRRQAADLALFTDFLQAEGTTPGDLGTNPAAWRGITYGLAKKFVKWQLAQGYSVGSVNVRLSTVKVYAGLAFQAGMISGEQAALISTVKGYGRKQIKHVNEKRVNDDIPTRRTTRAGMIRKDGTAAGTSKKTVSVSITRDQAEALCNQPDTPQGRRDALLMGLMLFQGLRVGEVAILKVTDFDLKAGELRFYRPKVDKTQTHILTPQNASAARAYLLQDAPAIGVVWRGSANKSNGKAAFSAGDLTTQGMSERAMTNRVKVLGEAVGLQGLSAHDCRHFAATFYADKVNKGRLTFKDFIDIFGWNSPAMALRYIESAKKLDVAAAYAD